MLQAISKANHNSRFVYVMDTRPKVGSGNQLGPALIGYTVILEWHQKIVVVVVVVVGVLSSHS